MRDNLEMVAPQGVVIWMGLVGLSFGMCYLLASMKLKGKFLLFLSFCLFVCLFDYRLLV